MMMRREVMLAREITRVGFTLSSAKGLREAFGVRRFPAALVQP
jgi:hypothetical protein